MNATTLVCEWFKGMPPEEGARRGVKRIETQDYWPGDRVRLRHNGATATVRSAEPCLHRYRDFDWLYYVTEETTGLTYPTGAPNLAAKIVPIEVDRKGPRS